MAKYTLTSYEPVEMTLPKPQVPESLVRAQIDKMMEHLAEYHEIAEDRGVERGDHLVVNTNDARIDGNLARHFILEHSMYHVGGGEMPRTFDDAIIGMKPGETRSVEAGIKTPLSQSNEPSKLTMEVTVEKILYCVNPELTDELVAEHFPPAKTVQEFYDGVAAQFGLPDMAKNDPQFPDLVLNEIAKRLVEEPAPEDALPGQPMDAQRITCAIDALADHLEIELDQDGIIAQMPGEDLEQRMKIMNQLQEQGLAEEAKVFARREAALSWLVNNSRISYK